MRNLTLRLFKLIKKVFMNKISIRFYNDRKMRAIWDEENSKWWFAILDIDGILNDQDDYPRYCFKKCV